MSDEIFEDENGEPEENPEENKGEEEDLFEEESDAEEDAPEEPVEAEAPETAEEPEEASSEEAEPDEDEAPFEEELEPETAEAEEEPFDEEPPEVDDSEEFAEEEPEEVGEEDGPEEDLFEEDEPASEEEYAEGDDTYVEETEVDDGGGEYVEETEESWFGRLGDAAKGVVIGGIIFLIGFPLLFWNEGRAVKRYRALNEGAGSVITVAAETVSPANEGKLVHVTGMARTDELLSDTDGDMLPKPVAVLPDAPKPENDGKLVYLSGKPVISPKFTDTDFNFEVGAVRLKRIVEMYQWREVRGASQTDKKLGGKEVTQTQLSYEKGWSADRVDSAKFQTPKGHENPPPPPYKGWEKAADSVKIGAFTLSSELLDDLKPYKALRFKELPKAFPADLRPKARIHEGMIYIGADPQRPAVGDIRVEYRAIRPQTVSVIAKQNGARLEPYPLAGKETYARIVPEAKTLAEIAPAAGITVNAIKLKRTVEMYQWRETEKTETVTGADGKKKKRTTYDYAKVWSETPIDSSKFKKTQGHVNPGQMPLESKTVTAETVNVGAYRLPDNFIARMSKFEPLPVKNLEPSLPASVRDGTTVFGEGFYMGKDPQNPRIGDLKISYGVVNPAQVSLIAAQKGNTFAPYETRNGGKIEEFRLGMYSAQEMIETAKAGNRTMTWVLRLVGFIVMFAGLMMVFKPVSVVLDVVPFLGNIAEKGVFVVALLMAGGFAMLTIAVAWFFYRPLLSLSLIAIAVGLVFGVKFLRERRGEASSPPPSPTASVPPPPPGG